MAETLGSGVRDEPSAPALSRPDSSLEERLRALEAALKAAPPPSGQPGAERGPTDQAARLEALAAEVAAQRERLRDQEKAMVERIADVDDDRRLTSSQLQRGWQAQRDEFEARLRRHGGFVGVAVVLALLGSGLFALSAHLQTPSGDLAAEVASLRQDLQRLSAVAQRDEALQERLVALSAAVGQVSSTVERQPARAAGADNPALTERLDLLATEQRRQDGELETLQRGLQALTAAGVQSRAGADRPLAASATESRPPKSAASAAAPAPAAAAAPKMTVTDHPFALQLSGGRNRDTIVALAARPDLPNRVFVYEYTRRGRPWFVLIHSLHASSAEAQATLAKIPAKLRSQAPWIRALPPGAEVEIIEQRAGHN